jgi:phosphatidylethanolamine/phosphatidyl-N-methylethanolamine N-methyltransferase
MSTSRSALPVFLSAAMRRPTVIGALIPSSPALARRLAAVAPTAGQPVVVELGAGTGAVSVAISRRLPDAGRHIAVELDGELAEHLREAFPDIDVAHANAVYLDAVLAERDLTEVDAVIGGLPWSLIGPPQQERILAHVANALAPGGAFTTFAYLHALPLGGARHFRRLLEATFDEVLPTRVVWRNFPPALTYVCRRPLATAQGRTQP